jgi:hypothetical protein
LEDIDPLTIKILDGSDATEELDDSFYYNAWELEDGVYLLGFSNEKFGEIYLDNSGEYSLTSGLVIVSAETS